jgi:hypothetical protein
VGISSFGEPAPLSARNLSKIAHIQLPALPPTVQRLIDCPIRGESARKRSRCSEARSLFRKKGRCSFTGAANGAVVLDHALPTPDSHQTIALLQRRADDAASVCFGLFKVAEQHVIRAFVTALIHFGCDRVDAFPVQSKALSTPTSSQSMSD